MDDSVDRRARHGTQAIYQDVYQNLAKVRVAGSSPVVRSRRATTRSPTAANRVPTPGLDRLANYLAD